MKAILAKHLTGPDNLVFGDHEIGSPEKGKIKIEVKYAGVNFPDILITQGKYQFQPDLPFSPGGEVAGIVKEIGEGVTGFTPGDRVIAGTTFGGFAEEVMGFGFNTFQLPADIQFKDAATVLMTHGTVMHALKDRGALRAGETLVVLGASGGVGTAAIQLGKIMGAKVVAFTSSEEKVKYCQAAGADEAYTYEFSTLKQKIKSLNGGKGADIIFDPIGGDYAEQAFRGVALMGRYLVVGFAAGNVPKISLNLPLLKSASIVGVFWGAFFRNFPTENKANVDLLFKWLRERKLIPLVDEIYTLEDAKSALKKLQNRNVKGKVLIKI